MPLYLGFDSSTQSLTATLIEAGTTARRVVLEDRLTFDEVLPQYGTRNGVLTRDGRTVTAAPRMWAEALEVMIGRLRDAGVPLGAIRAISGSAQQHGSVFLTADAARVLASLDPDRPLATQLDTVFARELSPVWLDCSTTAECAALTDAAGGDAALAAVTGSRAYERFTAAQIRKFAGADPAAYARTSRIHLVSSFMASLLCGGDAPLDPGDASGMNLMDIRTRSWSPRCLAATAPDLLARLPAIRESSFIAGGMSPYWRRRFGFGAAKVVTWTGDNPSSLIGLGLIHEGQLGISLGTSDTVFAPLAQPASDPQLSGHLFGSPAGGYMALTCFANGSLARERVRDQFGLDWPAFSAHLDQTPPGNGGALMLPWFVPEITPTVAVATGPHRHHLDPADAAANVRAVVEGQALAMRCHSRWFAPAVSSIRATGGAAANRALLQVIADVFGATVVRIAPPNAASLGAALRAFHADCLDEGRPISWPEAIAGFTDPAPGASIAPQRDAVATYRALLPEYERFVARVLSSLPR